MSTWNFYKVVIMHHLKKLSNAKLSPTFSPLSLDLELKFFQRRETLVIYCDNLSTILLYDLFNVILLFCIYHSVIYKTVEYYFAHSELGISMTPTKIKYQVFLSPRDEDLSFIHFFLKLEFTQDKFQSLMFLEKSQTNTYKDRSGRHNGAIMTKAKIVYEF